MNLIIEATLNKLTDREVLHHYVSISERIEYLAEAHKADDEITEMKVKVKELENNRYKDEQKTLIKRLKGVKKIIEIRNIAIDVKHLYIEEIE
jgi:hypothetical protein